VGILSLHKLCPRVENREEERCQLPAGAIFKEKKTNQTRPKKKKKPAMWTAEEAGGLAGESLKTIKQIVAKKTQGEEAYQKKPAQRRAAV